MRYSFVFYLSFFLFFFLSNSFLRGNTSSGSAKKKLSFTTNLSLGGNYQTGNTDKSGLSFAAQLSARDSIKEFSLNGKYNYGKDRGVKNLQDYLAGIQYDYHPYAVFSPFLRFELYSNEFQKISQRYSGLAGGKYRFYFNQQNGNIISEYSISAAVLIDYEKYISTADLADKDKYRLSVRPKFSQQVMQNILLNFELFYQPNLSDFEDYLINGKASLNFQVNKYVFLKSSYEYKYNSRPATKDVKKQDTLLLVSLGVEF